MQLTNQDLGKIKNLARKWGKIITEEAFGPEGPGLDVSFTEMENVWVAASRGIDQRGRLCGTEPAGSKSANRASVSAMWTGLRTRFARADDAGSGGESFLV